MKSIREIRVSGEQFLGSTITVHVVFDEVPSSVEIQIKDPALSVVQAAVAMVADSGNLYYTYDYQNVDSNLTGNYLAVIKYVIDGKTSYTNYEFPISDADPYSQGGF